MPTVDEIRTGFFEEYRAELRLAVGVAAGVAVTVGLGRLTGDTLLSLAFGWNAGVAVFLALTLTAIGASTMDTMRKRARQQDERGWVLLLMLLGAATISLVVPGMMIGASGARTGVALFLYALLGFATVFCSWSLVHIVFALHYAHVYYGDGPVPGGEDPRGGLRFPGEEPPDYWDMLYFSFVIGMTFQVSDVEITSRRMRKLALGHGILSFIFSTVIVALTINFLASASGG
jgi:uncharacterized membrane protein